MKIFSKKKDEDKVEEEIISMASEGNENGDILDEELEMITNIFEFGEKEAKDVMTPRLNIVGIEKNATISEVMEIMKENNYSRYPVYEEDIDNVVGVLYFKDFVWRYLENKNVKVANVMVEPYFVHPTQSISKLFKNMQKDKIHMALVVDEYGQTEGMVAMEDILEEIVGNIFDEYDEEDEDIVKGEQGYVVDGMTELDVIEELLEIQFPDEDFHTVNGFMLYELGGFPKENQDINIEYEGYMFKALEVKDKMIEKACICRVEKS